MSLEERLRELAEFFRAQQGHLKKMADEAKSDYAEGFSLGRAAAYGAAADQLEKALIK